MTETQAKKKSFKEVVREIATDPGVLWNICDTLLFATVNAASAISYGVATVVSAGCKACSETKPAFLKKYPKLAALLEDPRTPLRVGGLTSLLVAGIALASGGILPAITSTAFAVATFKVANSISEAMGYEAQKKEKTKKDPVWKQKLKKIMKHPAIKRPDLYASAGLMLAGMMAGGASLWALPLVAAGFLISTRNSIQDRPEHEAHPKAIFGLSAAIFAGVGATTGNWLPCAAHLVNIFVFMNIESRITPGGFKQVMTDIKDGITSFPEKAEKGFKRLLGLKPQNAPAVIENGQQIVPVDETPSLLMERGLKDFKGLTPQQTADTVAPAAGPVTPRPVPGSSETPRV